MAITVHYITEVSDVSLALDTVVTWKYLMDRSCMNLIDKSPSTWLLVTTIISIKYH